MNEAFSRAVAYACQLSSTECQPFYDPYSPNVISLALGALILGLTVVGAQDAFDK